MAVAGGRELGGEGLGGGVKVAGAKAKVWRCRHAELTQNPLAASLGCLPCH